MSIFDELKKEKRQSIFHTPKYAGESALIKPPSGYVPMESPTATFRPKPQPPAPAPYDFAQHIPVPRPVPAVTPALEQLRQAARPPETEAIRQLMERVPLPTTEPARPPAVSVAEAARTAGRSVSDILDAFVRGIGKATGLAEAGKAIGERYPETAKLVSSPLARAALEGKLAEEPKGTAEQIAETAGQIVPYIVMGPLRAIVAAPTKAVLTRYAPRLAGTALGRIIPSATGTAALGGAVAAGREALKGVAAPEEFQIGEALKEIGTDAARFAAFAAAGELAGKPAAGAIARALRKSVQTGRISPQLAQLITAPGRGGATGITLASVETALKYLNNPEEFDKAEAAGDILTTTLFFAGLDTIFALGSMAGRGFSMREPGRMDINKAYAELGLKRGASIEEVKKAYRNIAKQYHPDVRPGDKAAADKFVRAALAYGEILRTQRPKPARPPTAEARPAAPTIPARIPAPPASPTAPVEVPAFVVRPPVQTLSEIFDLTTKAGRKKALKETLGGFTNIEEARERLALMEREPDRTHYTAAGVEISAPAFREAVELAEAEPDISPIPLIETLHTTKPKPSEVKPEPEKPVVNLIAQLDAKHDPNISTKQAFVIGDIRLNKYDPEVARLFQQLGVESTGVRLADAEETGMLRYMLEKGQITQAEWDKHVAELRAAGKIKGMPAETAKAEGKPEPEKFATVEEAKPAEKEPWEMTREEWKAWAVANRPPRTIGEYTGVLDSAARLGDETARRLSNRLKQLERDLVAVGPGSQARRKRATQKREALLAEAEKWLISGYERGLDAKDRHYHAVREALFEGKPVPPEVLKDYPELVKKVKPEAKAEVPKAEVKPKLEKPMEEMSRNEFIDKTSLINRRKKELYDEIEQRPSSERFAEIQREIKSLEEDSAKIYKLFAKNKTKVEIESALDEIKKRQAEVSKVKPKPEPEKPAEMEAPKPEVKPETPDLPIPVSKDDIPYQLAYDAHRWNSMTPEKRAEQVQAEYVQHIEKVYNELKPLAETDEQKAILKEELERYRDGLINHYKAVLSARSKTASPMVTGPAKFPTAKNQKALEAERKRIEEMAAWQKKAVNTIKDKLKGARTEKQIADVEFNRLKKEATQVISTLKAIEAGELKGFDRSAFVNSLAGILKRSADRGNISAVKKTLEFIREQQAKHLKSPVFTDRHSIWKYAEKATEKPVVETKKVKTGKEAVAEYTGAKVVNNYDADRVQIIFDDKPSETLRKDLKSEGWRWAPSENAWQRKLTPNAEVSAKKILEKYFEKETKPEPEKPAEVIPAKKMPEKIEPKQYLETEQKKHIPKFEGKKRDLVIHKTVLPKRVTIPILEHVVVRDGVMYSTDLEISVISKTNLPDGVYSLVGKEKDLRAVKIETLNVEDAPEPFIAQGTKGRSTINLKEMQLVLSRVLDYVSQEAGRHPALTNVLLEVKGNEASLVSTDAYRLTVNTFPLKGIEDGRYLIPPKALKILLKDKALRNVSVFLDDKNISFDTGNWVLTARLGEGNYPNFAKTIPQKVEQSYAFNKAVLAGKIKELFNMKPGGKNNSAFFARTDKGFNITIQSQVTGGEYTVSVPAEAEGGGSVVDPKNISIVVPIKDETIEFSTGDFLINLKYVEDAVKNLPSPKVYLGWNGQFVPVLFSDRKIVLPETKRKDIGEIGKKDPLAKIKTEMGEEVDRVVGDVNIPIGQTIKIVNVSPDAKGMFSSADPEIDARVKAAHGVKSPSTFSKIKELMDSLVRKATREYEYLPGGKEFAKARFDLLRLSKQKGVAADETLRLIQGIIIDFKDNPKAYNLFEWKVLLNDLAEEAKAGRELPFGYTEEKLKTDLARLDEALNDYPEVTKAIEKRKKVWDGIIKAYVEAQKAIGFHVEDKFTKQDYFRHMVLEYANERSPYGIGKKLRTPTGRGFLKQRKGTELDINSNYLEAEYEVMAQMLYDIEVAKTIKNIDTDYNIIDQLKARAIALNDEKIMPVFEKIAAEWNQARSKKAEPLTAKDVYRRILNTKQAIGFEKLGKLAMEGMLPDNNGKYTKLLDALSDTYYQNMILKKDLGPDWTPEDQVMLPDWTMEQIFPYMNWLLKLQDETVVAGKSAAATVFKGIAEKKKYIKETLGEEYVTWEDLIPEGYTTWQPREGNIFYFADTIPAQKAEKLLMEGLKEIGVKEKDIRKVLAKGQKFPEMVIKEELAKTLDNLTKDRPVDPIKRGLRNIMKGWKVYQLVSPKRWAKYNFRNISGDAEAVFVGNPSAFKKVPQATKELYRVFAGDGAMTKNMRDWFERGGMQSLLQTQEIGDINNLRMFVNFMEKRGKITEIPTKIWQGYWKTARLSTDFREAILRYAAYLDYLEQLKANNGRPKNFGASNPEEVMALRSNEDKAYWLSNDLLGAYDKISVIGQELRESLYPFWSWKEVNFKRYIQFIKNAARDNKVAETVGRIALGTLKRSPFIAFRVGIFLIKAIGLWAALDIFNKKFFPEEEFELPADVRNTPHIVLGRDKNGKVRYFSRLGMLSDFLEWFGLEEAPGLVSDFLNGKKNLKEIAAEMAKGPVNALVQGVGPQYKIPAELIMGRKVFPDAFKPGMIRDRGYYIAQSLGLADEYSILMKLPRRPYKEKLTTFLVYEQDPGQGAYYDILDLKREFQKKIGKPSGFMSEVSPKSQALYNLKLAIRYQDKEAFDRYAAEYVNYGGTSKDLETSLRNMHPLHGLNDAEKKAFVKWLSKEDRKRLELAVQFYEETLLGKKKK